jgi:DnaJ-class molecular chaperone
LCRDVELYDELNIKTTHTPSPKELYLKALKGFGLQENSTNEEVKHIKRSYLLMYHPDKNPSNIEESKKHFIEKV